MQPVIIDLIPKGTPPICYASRGDNRREIQIIILENGVPYNLSGNEITVVDIRRPDNQLFIEGINNTGGNKLLMRSLSSFIDIPGKYSCRLRIIDGNTSISSSNFILEVEGF